MQSVTTTMNEDILDHPITRYMRFDFCRVKSSQSVAEALGRFAHSAAAGADHLFLCHGRRRQLEGVVPTRRLLLSQPDAKIADLMVRNVVRCLPRRPCAMRANCFSNIGSWRFRWFTMIGWSASSMSNCLPRGSTIWSKRNSRKICFSSWASICRRRSRRRRGPGSPAAFRGCYATSPAAFWRRSCRMPSRRCWPRWSLWLSFVPVVLGLSESVAIQSVTLALHVLHGQPPTLSALWIRLRRELFTGALLGAACGLIIGAVALAWLGLAQGCGGALGGNRRGHHRLGRVWAGDALCSAAAASRSASRCRADRARFCRYAGADDLFQRGSVAAGVAIAGFQPTT